MSFEQDLYDQIISECDKLIKRYHKYHNNVHINWVRNSKRIKSAPPKEIKSPSYWKNDSKFNPFYVRSNAKAIAKSIDKKIIAGLYKPQPPYEKLIPKEGGGERKLAIYKIPDAAVSKLFYDRLLKKNRHRFSSFSYAYRNDRNVHFAIQDITVDLKSDARTFIAEFDFSDFFGSINHDYLFAQFNANGFLISETEKSIIRSFLSTQKQGIPQGTSISLFLANLVCWKLDRSFEKAGLKFARYADDTIVWSPNYAAICKSFSIIDQFSKEAGVPINQKKSAGISLLSKKGLPTEIASKENFDFLGYSISPEKTAIKDAAIRRIKKQISYLLYRNLIQPLTKTPLQALKIPANNRDEDLLRAIMQVRRYMYGNLLHQDLISYIKKQTNRLYFKGVMSFYPLLTDIEQLRALDGWLVATTHRAIQKRSVLLAKNGHPNKHIFPFNVPQKTLTQEFRKRIIKGKRLLELPSFMLIYQAIQRGLVEYGIENVMHPASTQYNYKQ